MTTMINNIGDRMVSKARSVNFFIKDWLECKEEGSMRSNPIFSEFQGMKQLLKAMDIEFEIECNADLQMTAIVIMGKTFKV